MLSVLVLGVVCAVDDVDVFACIRFRKSSALFTLLLLSVLLLWLVLWLLWLWLLWLLLWLLLLWLWLLRTGLSRLRLIAGGGGITRVGVVLLEVSLVGVVLVGVLPPLLGVVVGRVGVLLLDPPLPPREGELLVGGEVNRSTPFVTRGGDTLVTKGGDALVTRGGDTPRDDDGLLRG